MIVLGNGFDLALGKKTSYASFFNSGENKTVLEAVMRYRDEIVKGNVENTVYYDTFTCWDLIFFLEAWYRKSNDAKANIEWKDIEQVIKNTLQNKNDYHVHLEKVYSLYLELLYDDVDWQKSVKDTNQRRNMLVALKIYESDYKKEEERILEHIIPEEKEKQRKTLFYDFFLQELIAFEKRFGHYIEHQTGNLEYFNDAAYALWNICDRNESEVGNLKIDSFNYSMTTRSNRVRHINGDYLNPIFGIDATADEMRDYPDIYMFTKTARRLKSDTIGRNNKSFEANHLNKAIVYGHSLNEQDYDYYVYLFTRLGFNTLDTKEMGQFVFCYSTYPGRDANEIRQEKVKTIFNLVNYYEDQITNHSGRRVLINLLRFSDKLVLREINNVTVGDFSEDSYRILQGIVNDLKGN